MKFGVDDTGIARVQAVDKSR